MDQLKRVTAFLLCLIFLIPTNGVSAAAAMSRGSIQSVRDDIQDVDEREMTNDIEDSKTDEIAADSSRYRNTVELESFESVTEEPEEWDGELSIYWNPGTNSSELEQIIATPSIGTGSVTKSNKGGSDHADGLTPERAVKSLNTAIRKAERLSRKADTEISDITIYAMTPMIIPEETMYTVRGKGVTVTSWEGRTDGSDLIFAVDGGQLMLSNLKLQPLDGGTEPEDAELIYIKSGKVQLAEKVESYGSFVLDYQEESQDWEYSSSSEAVASDAQAALENAPIVELLKKFDAPSEYYLDIRADQDQESVTAVAALYSDDKSSEEFLESFMLIERPEEEWELIVEERVGGVLRDTTDDETETATISEASSAQALRDGITRNEDQELTQKSLVAARGMTRDSRYVYWNPGGEIIIDGNTYRPGDDSQDFDGTTPNYAVKSWGKAVAEAVSRNRPIVCMQTIDLTNDATAYLDGTLNDYVMDGTEAGVHVMLWTDRQLPVLRVPSGVTVTLSNVSFSAQTTRPNYTGDQLIRNQGGELVIGENVKTESGYIQIDLEYENLVDEPPITVNSENIKLNLYFSGLHHDIRWRYHDVVKAGGDLLAKGADEAGTILKQTISLEAANYTTVAEGGQSEYKWDLRKDTDEDYGPFDPSRLELFTSYYYDAVYLDGIRGDDANSGASCFLPVKTFDRAAEIVKEQMERSVNARLQAASEAERDTISLPTKIYICGTVTITDEQRWSLPVYYDYDKTPIHVEMVTHMDVLNVDGTQAHPIEDVLVHVKGTGGKLTLGKYDADSNKQEGLVIRSIADQFASSTILVDEGATLVMEHTAELTGLKDASDPNSRTEGVHVLIGKASNAVNAAVTSGYMEMSDNWTGSINNRSIGIDAYGTGSEIIMKNGRINKNKNIQTSSSNNMYSKAGVSLTGNVKFVMQGGEISENESYFRGAGVYMIGNSQNSKAEFQMLKGLIKDNVCFAPRNNTTQGIGVYAGNFTVFEMGEETQNNEDKDHTLCQITGNITNTIGQGAGIYVETYGTLKMNSGTISKNLIAGSTNYSTLSYGGGIYNRGTLNITGGIITENGAKPGNNYQNVYGAGIYLGAGNSFSQTISNAVISKNMSGGYTSYSYGGGIYVAYKANIEDCIIEENRAHCGAGLYLTGGTNESVITNTKIRNNIATVSIEENFTGSPGGIGGGMYVNGTIRVDNVEITGNRAASGGGSYHNNFYGYYQNSKINNNQSSGVAGGAYINNTSYSVYFYKMEVNENRSSGSNGGGIYAYNDNFFITESTITDNYAGQNGGGIYNVRKLYLSDTSLTGNEAGMSGGALYNSGTIHISERTAGASVLSGNKARLGGGAYLESGKILLDLSGEIKNTAAGNTPQGNNFYVTGESELTLLDGIYSQPDSPVEGTYNFYLHSVGAVMGILKLDPQQVEIGGDNHIYLANTNNYLKYLNPVPNIPAPGAGEDGKLPIDVNEEVFAIGSPIIKPADEEKITVTRADTTGLASESYDREYTRLKKANERIYYSKGSKLPLRTVLGGYPDPGNAELTNVVLVGEGIYLRGEASGGDDLNHNGTEPEDAVATFGKAKELLLQAITDAENDDQKPEGFTPVIYICGNVPITADEDWELNFSDSFFTDAKYVEYETAEGRVPEQAQVKRFASFLTDPMITVSESGTTLTVKELIIDGMAGAVDKQIQHDKSPIIEALTGTNIVLLDEAWVRNNYYNMLEINGTLRLEGAQNASNHQIDITKGTGVNLYSGADMVMNGYSRIIFSEVSDVGSYNSYHLPGNPRGVMVEEDSSLTMNEYSKIEFTRPGINYGSTNAVGVVLGNESKLSDQLVVPDKARLVMNKEAMITNLRAAVALDNYHIDFEMNEQSSLVANYTGIYSYNRGMGDISIILNQDAAIRNGYDGIYLYGGVFSRDGSEKIEIHLNDNSLIQTHNNSGIMIQRMYTKFEITMNDNAAILDSRNYGIYETDYGSLGIKLMMNDNTWIGASRSGYQNYGIFLSLSSNTIHPRNTDIGDCYQIIMTGNALIGGDELPNSTAQRRGNSTYGILAYKPLHLEMSGNSGIAYNGAYVSSYGGLHLSHSNDSRFYPSTSKIVLKGTASIHHNNGYGIYGSNKLYSSNLSPMYQEDIEISENASVRDNSYPIQLINTNANLTLRGNALIDQQTQNTTDKYAITTYGSILMEGSVEIKGITRLYSAKNPITLLSPVTGSISGKYKLHLEQAFVGKIVVQPGGSITDATVYYDSFSKVLGSGVAVDKELKKDPPNIVLDAENNVYLSGTGLDTNDGRSPATPVRTFKKARELLREGDFTTGANIYICGIVTVQSTDLDWSFDSDGTITNEVNNVTWTPVVYRYKEFYDYLISINNQHVTFEHITIDGLGENLTVDTQERLKVMLYIAAGKATLGEGAVLQNNRINRGGNYLSSEINGTLGVYVNTGAAFEMRGGTIRNMELNSLLGYYTSPYYGVAIKNLGTVDIYSGTIEDCKIEFYPSQNYSFSADIISNRSTNSNRPATFNMYGGEIKNNEIALPRFTNRNILSSTIGLYSFAPGYIKGGLIADNIALKGSAIYYNSDEKLILEGGRIRGNQAYHDDGFGSTGIYSPIYIANSKFELKGGGSVIEDPIYLDSVRHIITLSDNIYQSNRRYDIFVNQQQSSSEKFGKGSVVVQPNGDTLLDATGFLINFTVHSTPYTLDRGQSKERLGGTIDNMRESQCLLLMQMVFLDSRARDTTGIPLDGTTPERAVFTFEDAKAKGEAMESTSPKRDYYIIYLSGPAYNKGGEKWELADTAYMCRYTGFEVYDENNMLIPAAKRLPYHNELVVTQGDLFLENIRIYGRRVIDNAQTYNGDSILLVSSDVTVTMNEGTLLSRNYNMGSYWDAKEAILKALKGTGGAIYVDTNGTLLVNGGEITEVVATEGAAIYQNADLTDLTKTRYARVVLDNSPLISGDIFLNGRLNAAEAFVEVTSNYVLPGTGREEEKLYIRLQNDYDSRLVVKYPNGVTPTDAQLEFYRLEDSITAIYDFTRDVFDDSKLVLQLRQLIYLDGQNGDDIAHSGDSPDQALRTPKAVYQKLAGMSAAEGAMVMIVGHVDVDQNMEMSNESYLQNGLVHSRSYYQDDTTATPIVIQSKIYFKRYSKPSNTSQAGYTAGTHKGTLFTVKPGYQLSLRGIFLNGHSEASSSNYDYLTADAVEALAPLILVEPGAKLFAGFVSGGEGGQSAESPAMLFSNNKNVNFKTNVIGYDNLGDPVIEGSGAGIEILSDASGEGEAVLEGARFQNMELAAGLNGGTDIYQNGRVAISREAAITGSVFLEGFGTASDPSSSRWIDVGAYGTPFEYNFNVKMRDPYNRRVVAKYPNSVAEGPNETQIGTFLLEEEVNRYFALMKKPDEKNVLELYLPDAVYIDGQNGTDGADYGHVPTKPLKTLYAAYQRLRDTGGKAIYVVGTVDITNTVELTATSYIDGANQIVNLYGNRDHIDIRRFVRPVAGTQSLAGSDYDAQYDRDNFEGTLLRVKGNASLTLKDHVYVDGHYEPKTDPEYLDVFRVETNTESRAPLIEVEREGILRLQVNSTLYDNHNVKALTGNQTRVIGGAVNNSGKLEFASGLITNNKAEKGAGIYQNGTFEILHGPEGLEDQEIYLTTPKSGSDEETVWGTDHIIETDIRMPDDLKLDLQMDHPVAGRPVIRYSAHSGVDDEHVHYTLGNTVPTTLFLVESPTNDSLLELQDWRVLDVTVPKEIFLVVQQTRSHDFSLGNAEASGLTLGSPEYTIKNNGRYDANVFLSGFENENDEAGITAFEKMKLVETAGDAVSGSATKNEFYLAVKGADSSDPFGALTETSLYNYGTDGTNKKLMGLLAAGEEGKFEFVAAASNTFMTYYDDKQFPFLGSQATAAGRIAHLRNINSSTGETSANHARAKYKMTYRVEIVPPRR